MIWQLHNNGKKHGAGGYRAYVVFLLTAGEFAALLNKHWVSKARDTSPFSSREPMKADSFRMIDSKDEFVRTYTVSHSDDHDSSSGGSSGGSSSGGGGFSGGGSAR